MLTPKQHNLLMFIHNSIQTTGFSPSFDEMKTALSLKSKSGIHRLITALEERGYIRRLPHRARALEILRLPDNLTNNHAKINAQNTLEQENTNSRHLEKQNENLSQFSQYHNKPHLSILNGAKGSPVVGRHAQSNTDSGEVSGAGIAQIPLIGRIAAGIPIEALQNPSNTIAIPTDMLAKGAEHFALEVRGDSMIEAGILDGDTVVISKQDNAANGDIIVALIEGQEATLKRLRRRDGGVVALEAANSAYETRLYPADQIRVQGRLVGLLRSF